MAEPESTKDALDLMQRMFNDALIQTGKALRASRQDGPAPVQTLGSVPFKLPDTITLWHNALNKIDQDIIRAKAILGRDLERLQNKDANITPPQPVDAQTKSPMVIDVESSPVQTKTEPPAVNGAAETQPVAPFPNMGMDIPTAAAPTDFGDVAPQAPMPDMGEMQPVATMAPEPTTQAEDKPQGAASNDIKMDAPSENFTNMQFTLAPAEPDTPENAGAQDPPFDMAAFTTNDAGNGTIDLNTLLPPSTEQSTTDPLAAADFGTSAKGQTDGAAAGSNEAAFDDFDIDNMDWGDGAADGSDFDFGINDADNFNDLMKNHDDINDMEHGQFDTDFFGLNNNDNNDGA